MRRGVDRQLDPSLKSKAVEDFERNLRHKVIGQDAAVDAVVNIFQMFTAELNPPNHPVGNLLFLGPTGTGKTRVLEAAADILFGNEHALVKVDCAEFQHSHEIAKLIGSPPGYLGHRETNPVFTQEALNQYHTDSLRLTFILFDEIEKASDSLWQLLLGVLDKGVVTLGDNRRIDMTACVIVMTANIGATEMSAMASNGIGFTTKKETNDLDDRIQNAALAAAKRKFSPEFMNRIDKSVVFKTLRSQHLEKILDLELESVQQRVLRATTKFLFECTPDVKQQLLEEGTSPEYGARYLKRVIERRLVLPLSSLVATGQIRIGDSISVNKTDTPDFKFVIEEENAIVPMLLAKYNDMGITTAAHIPVPRGEESHGIRQARMKLEEAEEALREAKERKAKLLEENMPVSGEGKNRL